MRYGYDKCDGDGCKVVSDHVPFPHEPGCRYGTGDPSRDQMIRDFSRAPDQPPIILPPIYDRDLLRGGVRYPCPRSCGWAHVEHPGLEPFRPLRLRVPTGTPCATATEVLSSISSAEFSRAITESANAQADEHSARLLKAFADHYVEDHPGLPAPVLNPW